VATAGVSSKPAETNSTWSSSFTYDKYCR
jgi:hypothetical protein